MKGILKAVAASVFTLMAVNIYMAGQRHFSPPYGDIEFGQNIFISKRLYLPINITNYGGKGFDGLILSVPGYVDVSEISASHPLDILVVPASVGSVNEKYIKINLFKSLSTYEILIPLNDVGDKVLPVNSSDLNLGVTYIKDRHESRVRQVKRLLSHAGVFLGILIVLFVFYVSWDKIDSWQKGLFGKGRLGSGGLGALLRGKAPPVPGAEVKN